MNTILFRKNIITFRGKSWTFTEVLHTRFFVCCCDCCVSYTPLKCRKSLGKPIGISGGHLRLFLSLRTMAWGSNSLQIPQVVRFLRMLLQNLHIDCYEEANFCNAEWPSFNNALFDEFKKAVVFFFLLQYSPSAQPPKKSEYWVKIDKCNAWFAFLNTDQRFTFFVDPCSKFLSLNVVYC